MKRLASLLLAAVIAALCIGCGNAPVQTGPEGEARYQTPAQTEGRAASEPQETPDETGEGQMEKTLRLRIGDLEAAVIWEDNASVEALTELAKTATLTIPLSMYGGFEQVGPLGTSLPREDTQITTQAGDIVLYSGDQIVIFYGPNSWAYTRLGRIADKSASELAELLGNGDVSITVSWE